MKRSTFLKNMLSLFGATVIPVDLLPSYDKIFLLQCFVRGFQYYDGHKLLHQMQQNRMLTLQREPNNKYDECAIAIYYQTQKIGYIPREENEILSKILDADLLTLAAEIVQVEKNVAHWEQVNIAIYCLKPSQNNTAYEYLKSTQTPIYYTLNPTNCYGVYEQENYRMNAEDFYESLVENSQDDSIFDILHEGFPSHDAMHEALEEGRIIVHKNKLNTKPQFNEVCYALDNKILALDDYFGEEGYVIANIDKVTNLSDKIEKIEPVLDKLGRTFYEIVFK